MFGFGSNKKPQGLHFGDDFIIRDVQNVNLEQSYLFDKKKDRAWPLIHKLLLSSNGGFPYSQLMTDGGVLDPFGLLTEEERKTVGDGKTIAKSSIREVMHKTMKQSAGHTTAIILGAVAAFVFVAFLVLVLVFVKGRLSVR